VVGMGEGGEVSWMRFFLQDGSVWRRWTLFKWMVSAYGYLWQWDWYNISRANVNQHLQELNQQSGRSQAHLPDRPHTRPNTVTPSTALIPTTSTLCKDISLSESLIPRYLIYNTPPTNNFTLSSHAPNSCQCPTLDTIISHACNTKQNKTKPLTDLSIPQSFPTQSSHHSRRSRAFPPRTLPLRLGIRVFEGIPAHANTISYCALFPRWYTSR